MLWAQLGRDVLDATQSIVAVSRDSIMVKDDEAVAMRRGSDHPDRHSLLADVLAQLVEIHDPSKRCGLAARGAAPTESAGC